jgi:hypothetical protein
VIDSNGINLLDFGTMGDGYIRDKLLDFNVGRYANQEQEFLPRGPQSGDVNEERENDGPHRVDPPLQFRAAYRRKDTQAVDE